MKNIQDNSTDSSESLLTETVEGNEERILAGNTKSLVEKLFDYPYNYKYMQNFLLGFRYFTNPKELLYIIKKSWHHLSGLSEKQALKKRKGIVIFLTSWIEIYYQEDFMGKKELEIEILSLIEQIIEENPDLSLLRETFDKQFSPERRKFLGITDLDDIRLSYPRRERNKTWTPNAVSFFQHPPRDVADQMTLLHSGFYESITERELLPENWCSDEKDVKALNVTKMIEFSNHISHWVATLVLKSLTEEECIQNFDFFLSVVKVKYLYLY